MSQRPLRGIPAVHRFLSDSRIAAFEPLVGKEPIKESIDEALDGARAFAGEGLIPTFDELRSEILRRLETRYYGTLVPVINATGIMLHTNLGRAPLAQPAIAAMGRIGGGYCNIEYDIEDGRRGSRYARARDALRAATGAQDALVVNNCAAAVLLILDTFAKGREVIVARGQLVEVGGGFRLPDVLERSGAKLVEVGATNKVYLRDFERALSPNTGLILRSHTSNYRITGFTHDVAPSSLVALGRRAGIPVVEDLGSGALVGFEEYGLDHERTVQEAIADGIDLLTFSGDKLLGGPQAGIIAGAQYLIARLQNNALIRALRVDKLTFSALMETLRLCASPKTRAQIPFYRMLSTSIEELRARAQAYCASTGGKWIESTAYVGGGSLPETGVRSIAVAIAPSCGLDDAARRLRRAATPIIARIQDERLLFDLRTIVPEQDAQVIAAIAALPR